MKKPINPKSPIILKQISIGDILNMNGSQELVIDKSSFNNRLYIRTLRKSLCEGLLDTIEEVLYEDGDVPSRVYIVDRYHPKLDSPKFKQGEEKLKSANIY